MLDSGFPFDSVAVAGLSAAVLVPIVVFIAGCAFCIRWCRGNGTEDDETRPLLTENKREQHTTATIVNEDAPLLYHGPETRLTDTSPLVTKADVQIEEDRTLDEIPEEALIPDLLKIDESRSTQEHFIKTHAAYRPIEPDILEPQPAAGIHGKTTMSEQSGHEIKSTKHDEQDDRHVEKQEERLEKQQTRGQGVMTPPESDDAQVRKPDERHEIQQEDAGNEMNRQKTSGDFEKEVEALKGEEKPLGSASELGQLVKPVNEEATSVKSVNDQAEPAIQEPVKIISENEEHTKPPSDLELIGPINDLAELQKPVNEQGDFAKPVIEDSEPVKPVGEHVELTEQINEQVDQQRSASEQNELLKPVSDKAEPGEQTQDAEAAFRSKDDQEQFLRTLTVEKDATEELGSDDDTPEFQASIVTDEAPEQQHTSTKKSEETEEEIQKKEEALIVDQKILPAAPGLDFDAKPAFVKSIRTKAAKREAKAIYGLTVLDRELFVIHQHRDDVEVYDSDALDFKYQFHLEGLFDPVDISSSDVYRCLYIFDFKGESNEIIKVDASGKLIKKWPTIEDGGFLSVTPESNVILSSWESGRLIEYTGDGELIREIQLSSDIRDLRLGIKMVNGLFIISHADDGGGLHRVCLIDDRGTVVKSFGEKNGSSNTQLDSPNYMAVDGSGFVLVADQNNKRVVLLSPELEFKKELFQVTDGLRYPVRLYLNQASGRLFIADNDYLLTEKTWRDGRIIAFDLKLRGAS